MAQQVFYDPRRARWKRIRRLFDILGVSIMLIVIFFVYSALQGERLPELLLPTQKKPYHALKESEKQKAKEHRRLMAARHSHRKTKSAPSLVKLNAEEGIRAAFYVTWDAASFSSLREYARQIDLLFPEWLSVITPDGRLQGVDPQTNKLFDVIHGATIHPVDDRVMPFVKSENTGMEVFPLVNNFNGVDWVDISAFLNNPAARATFRQQIALFLSSDKYRGLMVDFEAFPRKGQPGYRALLRELANDLHAKGLKLYVSVPSHNTEWDYRTVSKEADGVVVMNYDEHYPGGEAGPVASQDWFVSNLKFAQTVIPHEKLICAFGNFGYDWPHKPAHGKLPAGEKDIPQTVQEAWLAARDSDSDVDFDSDSLNPHISYLDEKNIQHDIWFLDAVTALNEMRAAQELGIRTFALWRLGAEEPALWRVWDAPGESGAAEKLKDAPPGQSVDMEPDKGELLRVEAEAHDGQRSVTVDPNSRLITDESFDSLPEPYRVGRYGLQKDEVSLTFDDGPDPEWTPKILDILKNEHTTATFFLIGIQADKYAGLASRIYDEGNAIGNHTFTHPDISSVSHGYIKLELNLTERLFASRLGIRTLLFRPPYSTDAEPDTADQVEPLEIAQEMGYITVGDKIDPNDWRDNPRRSADQIASFVLAHLPPCAINDVNCGNIILFHDGGGNREQTVLALPRVIEGIRAKGLKIVPVYQLIGKTREQVMPEVPAGERWSAMLTWIAFWLFDITIKAITWVFFLGDLLMTGRLLFMGAFAIADRLRKRHFGTPEEIAAYQPKVAVLIPAFNEEKVIARTIQAALNSNYRKLRVIVIDDGSSDQTLEIARAVCRTEEASGRALVLTKANAGKAEALNFGLEHLRDDEEIFVGIDADTVIAPDAVARLVPDFLDPRIGALAGNAKVGNRVSIWTRWQALEYITSQNFERRALNILGAVSVVPGAIGAWRTLAVREAGGYHTDTVAEDADLTMALLQRGYRVEYEDRALAYTEAPLDANGLMRQRFRWSFGILQSVWKHRGAFARKGVLGWVALPNIIVFQILLPLFSPFIDIMFGFGTLWYYIQKYFHPESTDPASFHKLVLFFVAFLVIDFFTSTVAFALERREPQTKEDVALLSQVWLQRFAYRQLLSVVLFKTLKRAAEGRKFAWDKLERTAAVTYRPSEDHDSVEV